MVSEADMTECNLTLPVNPTVHVPQLHSNLYFAARPKNEEERKALQQNVDFLHRRREARLKEFCGPGTITDTIEKMKKELDRYRYMLT